LEPPGWFDHLIEHAIHAKADAELFLERFDVDGAP
jgi:hypothetical protein